jgi:radical SAM protein with 4Fe4S-binding SPASM domain
VRLHVGRALEAALELGVFVETNVDEIFRDPRLEDPRDSPFRVLQENAAIVELFRPGFCISTAIMALVEWDGTVIPCCRDHIVLGNLHQQSFMDIWNGAQMRDLRASFFRRELRDYCKRCMGFYNGHS